jgi:tRNA (guanine-N7-)-methyltransferase
MSRRTFAIRNLRPARPDAATAQRYLLPWHDQGLYTRPGAFPAVSAASLFGDERPLHLDVGCGTGEFLCALAVADPQGNYLGVDSSLKSLHVAVAQARALGLERVRFVWAQVQGLYPLLAPGGLAAAYLHFPDPCLHAKERHRAVFSAAFLDQMAAALAVGGTLSVMTDVAPLFARMSAALAADERFARVPAPALPAAPGGMASRYGSRWLGHGVEPLRIVVQRR